MITRTVIRTLAGMPTSDGAGVKLTRIIGTPALDHFDPFLLLDEFKNENPADYIQGFPPHPHRGFETVTYMIAGNFTHEDSRGNRGHLGPGSVQWMTAGKGLIHSEMPAQENGLVWGFQLWINLPARLKGIEPAYQDIDASRIPKVELDGVRATVIAGEVGGTTGPGRTHYPMTYLDLEMRAGAVFRQPLPATQNSMVFVISGSVAVGEPGAGSEVKAGQLALLSEGDQAALVAGTGGCRLLFLAAERMNEPVVRAGPFVMNTRAEILKAFEDYKAGRIG